MAQMNDKEFKKLGRDTLEASAAYNAKLAEWYDAAKAYAAKHGRDDIAGGMGHQRLIDRLKTHVLAELPKWLKIEGSGDARKYLKTHPALPGLE
jgi:hypothetical protein